MSGTSSLGSIILGLYRVILGFYRVYIGIMEKTMETTTVYIGVTLALYLEELFKLPTNSYASYFSRAPWQIQAQRWTTQTCCHAP